MQNSRLKFFAVLVTLCFSASCQTAQKAETNVTKAENPAPVASPPRKTETAQTFPIVEVPKFVGKSPAEFDNAFGQALETKPIKDPNVGEYRVYKIPNHEKGLAVRFYGGKAKSFNLILSASFPTSKEALLKAFGIDTGNLAPKIDNREPLSEKWSGTFNGVNFSNAYAKKQRPETSEFIFVLAEVK